MPCCQQRLATIPADGQVFNTISLLHFSTKFKLTDHECQPSSKPFPLGIILSRLSRVQDDKKNEGLTMYFTKFELKTDKKMSENIDKLKEFICTDKQPVFSFNFDFKGKPFFGTIKDNKFEIMPVIEGRNSFAPVMKGEVIGDSQSIIVVKMRLHLLVLAFIILLSLFIVWTLRNNLQNGGLVVLPVIYLVTILLYLKESKKYKKKFESLFE